MAEQATQRVQQRQRGLERLVERAGDRGDDVGQRGRRGDDAGGGVDELGGGAGVLEPGGGGVGFCGLDGFDGVVGPEPVPEPVPGVVCDGGVWVFGCGLACGDVGWTSWPFSSTTGAPEGVVPWVCPVRSVGSVPYGPDGVYAGFSTGICGLSPWVSSPLCALLATSAEVAPPPRPSDVATTAPATRTAPAATPKTRPLPIPPLSAPKRVTLSLQQLRDVNRPAGLV